MFGLDAAHLVTDQNNELLKGNLSFCRYNIESAQQLRVKHFREH